MFCWNCGKQIPDNAEFCSYCGKETLKDDVNDNTVNSTEGSNDASGMERYIPVQKKSSKKVLAIAIPIVAVCIIVAAVFAITGIPKGVAEVVPGLSIGKEQGVWREMSRKGYDINGNLLCTYEFERDEEGRTLTERKLSKTGAQEWHITFEYNEDDTTRERIRYDNENQPGEKISELKTMFEYDDNKRVLIEKSYYRGGMYGNNWKNSDEWEYSYNADGKTLEEKQYLSSDNKNKILSRTAKYEYLEHETRKHEYDKNGLEKTLTVTKLDGDNHVVERIIYHGATEDTPVSYRYKYERNSQGLTVREESISYDLNGDYKYSTEELYEHDQNGNVSKKTVNHKGGLYKYDTVIYECEFKYYPVNPENYRDYAIYNVI